MLNTDNKIINMVISTSFKTVLRLGNGKSIGENIFCVIIGDVLEKAEGKALDKVIDFKRSFIKKAKAC